MLVLGGTLMGQKCSSYDYTMGFGVSARVIEENTRSCVTPPRFYSVKSNTYLSKLKEVYVTFVRTKVTLTYRS